MGDSDATMTTKDASPAVALWGIAVLGEPTWWLFLPTKAIESMPPKWTKAHGYWLFPVAESTPPSDTSSLQELRGMEFTRDPMRAEVLRDAVFCVDVEAAPLPQCPQSGRRRFAIDADEVARLHEMFAAVQKREQEAEAARRAAEAAAAEAQKPQKVKPVAELIDMTNTSSCAPSQSPSAPPAISDGFAPGSAATIEVERRQYKTKSIWMRVMPDGGRVQLRHLGGPTNSWVYFDPSTRATRRPAGTFAERLTLNAGLLRSHTGHSFIIADTAIDNATGKKPRRESGTSSQEQRRKARTPSQSSGDDKDSESSDGDVNDSDDAEIDDESSAEGSDEESHEGSNDSDDESDDDSDDGRRRNRKRGVARRGRPTTRATSTKAAAKKREPRAAARIAAENIVRVGCFDYAVRAPVAAPAGDAVPAVEELPGRLSSIAAASCVIARLKNGSFVTVETGDVAAAAAASSGGGKEVLPAKLRRGEAAPEPAITDIMNDLLGCIEEAKTEQKRQQ